MASNTVKLTCTRCRQIIIDPEYLKEADGPRHLNACPPREITHDISVQVLYPWLEEAGVSEAELDAIESQLQENLEIGMCFKDGCGLLVHADAVISALSGVANVDTEDHSGDAALIAKLETLVRASGVRYWLIGADTLPLEV